MPDQEQATKSLSLNEPDSGDSGPPAPAGPTVDPGTAIARDTPTLNPAPVPSGKVRLAVTYPVDEFFPGEDLPVVTAFGVDVDSATATKIKDAAEVSGLAITEVRS